MTSAGVPFSGSYAPHDVQFLLRRLPAQQFTSVADKEALIQSGRKHYSEMLSPEALPSARYLQVFEDACAANLQQMARDCLLLAASIAARGGAVTDTPITLVSLARAGTPVGVLQKRLLEQVFKRRVSHYSVSIVRDRGIDAAALRHILAAGHAAESIVFIDGWTGKGVIAGELARSVAAFNEAHGVAIDSGLYVLSDLAGVAACASSARDYLIPSSILNATVSGLISRTVISASADEFHGCVYYEQFAPHDQSRRFVEAVLAAALAQLDGGIDLAALPVQAPERAAAAATSRACLARLQAAHAVSDVNLIKPGIGEATRVLLRRVPRLLLVRDAGAPDVRHLVLLAQEKNVPVVTDPALPYQAVSLIRSALDG
ncbi:MAG: cysteine protease StiP domain-containing protein [Duganella sp.]